jgi:hypothetical protein
MATQSGHVNPTCPRACYGEGKRVAKTLTRCFHNQDSVDVRVGRVFYTYGPCSEFQRTCRLTSVSPPFTDTLELSAKSKVVRRARGVQLYRAGTLRGGPDSVWRRHDMLIPAHP